MLKKTLLFLPLLLSSCAAISTPVAPPRTVNKVDLHRYMGRWYEIASFPNYFQRGCQCTQANYRLQGSKVHVLNRCYKGAKYKLSEANGVAWPVAGSSNSKLKVQFFWPFKGDYWILYLSPGYKQVLVGSPNRKYLWILSRTKTIKDSLYNKLVGIARGKGFAVNKLVATKQRCNVKNR